MNKSLNNIKKSGKLKFQELGMKILQHNSVSKGFFFRNLLIKVQCVATCRSRRHMRYLPAVIIALLAIVLYLTN